MTDPVERQEAIVTAVRAAVDWHKLANPQYSIAYCIGEAMRQLPPAQPEQRWIPCSERLPEDGTEVFVYLYDRPSPYIAWVEDRHWYTDDFEVDERDYPAAWMPLPEPYKEGEKDDN